MLKRQNDCVDCGLPCLGSSCPNRNVIHFYCDCCGDDVETLFEYEGEQLCFECIKKKLPQGEKDYCEDCGDEDEAENMFVYEETTLCETCLRWRLKECEIEGDF